MPPDILRIRDVESNQVLKIFRRERCTSLFGNFANDALERRFLFFPSATEKRNPSRLRDVRLVIALLEKKASEVVN